MTVKIINKTEAVRIAWLLTNSLGEEAALKRWPEIKTWENEESRDGKWRDQRSWLAGTTFSVFSSRSKHRDGRIRDAETDVRNLSEFAAWLLRNRDDAVISALIPDVIAKAGDKANVIRSVDGKHAKGYLKRSFPPEASLDDVARLLTEAIVFERLAA